MRKILDGLAEHPTVVAVASGVGAAVCGSGLRQAWGHWTMLAWMGGIAVFLALPAVTTRHNKLHQGRQAAEKCIKNVLAACASAYGYPDRHVRTNVMRVITGGRRKVEKATAFNMERDGDCDLEIDATAGVSGEAFVQHATAYGDLGLMLGPGGPTWGLRPPEQAKVRRDLRSILSVPIFDPDHPDALLGTLQVDSDLTFHDMEFDTPDRRAVAERFADVVALLMKVGS